MRKILTLFVLLSTLSCCNNSDHYRINCCEDGTYTIDHHGILYYTESCNPRCLQELHDTLKLKQYLTKDEMTTAFEHDTVITETDTSTTYFTEFIPWDTLYVNDNYTAELILIIDNTDNRGYYFQIRTYDKNRKVIAMQDFATWADKLNKYCSGDYIRSKNTFTVTCENIETEYVIDQHGSIRFVNDGSQ